MGGKLSCVQSTPEESETKEKENKPNHYEEIDDNFTILPDPSHTASSDVTTKPNVVGTYENVDLPSPGNQHKHKHTVIQTTETQIHPNSSQQAHQHVAIQSRPTKEIQTGVIKKTNQNGSDDVASSSNKKNGLPTGGTTVYAQVMKPKRKDGEKSKSSESTTPPVKPKPITKLNEPITHPVKGQELNYIEVEFSSTPAAKKTDPSTNYTDVIHDGGRLVLMQ